MTLTRARPGARFVDLIGLALVWGALHLLIWPVGDFATNDDWVYGLAVQRILADGSFALPSPSTANVALQAYWGALFCLPFGFSFTALRASTLVAGFGGIAMTYLLVEELTVRRRALALVGALTLAANPLYVALSEGFMTDVPFAALLTASCWSLVRGLKRQEPAATLLGLALALAALMIRQFAVILPVGFGVAYLANHGFRPRRVLVAVVPTLVAVGLHLGFQAWLRDTGRTPVVVIGSIADIMPLSAIVGLVQATTQVTSIVLSCGLFLAPLYLLLRLPRLRAALRAGEVKPWQLGAFAFLAVVATLAMTGLVVPGLGNALSPWGLGPLTLRDTYILHVNFPESAPVAWIWRILQAISLVGSVVLVADLVGMVRRLMGDRGASRDGDGGPLIVLLSAALAYLGLMFLLSLRWGLFDRYVLTLLPLLIGAAASAVPADERITRASGIAAGLLLGGFAVFSVLATHDYMAWQRARHEAETVLLRAGVSPRQIDGGYEFNGWRGYDPAYQVDPARSYWWVVDDTYVIASGELPGYRVVARYPFRRWLLNAPAEIVTLERVPDAAVR